MKKTYITPAMLAVTMQSEDNILVESIQNIDGNGGSTTGIGYGSKSDEDEGALAKGHSIWDEEW